MKQILLIGLLLLATLRVAGQKQNVDSLINVLNTHTLTSTERFGLYHSICKYYEYNDLEQMKIYAEKGIESAQKENDNWRLSIFIDFMGRYYMNRHDFDLAAKYAEIWDSIHLEALKKNFQGNLFEIEAKYETEKKEIRIASLEKERQLYVWLGITGSLLVIFMTLVLWQNKNNTRKEQQLIASKAVQDGELNERARLAEDLHDRLGGSLSAVKIGLRNAESLQNVGDKLDECIKEVREITHNLMPRSLRLFGMKGALEDFTVKFSNTHFHFFGKDSRIKERMEFAIYCCASELITNSLRHSRAENINIQLVQDEKYISLTVQDDGCGFDEKTVKQGIGLKNIRDRVASFNGKLDIASSPGNGTETIIELKIHNS